MHHEFDTIQISASAAGYVLHALFLMLIAQKLRNENAWFAWVPILNLILLCDLAGKSWTWIFLFCIPLVNIIVYIVLWMGVAEARGKSSLLGLLMICPPFNIIGLAYLALSD